MDSFGFSLEGRITFRVNYAFYRSLHQFCIGKSGYAENSPVMNWSLNVRMARSDELRWCMPGGGKLVVEVLGEYFLLKGWGVFIVNLYLGWIEDPSHEVIM